MGTLTAGIKEIFSSAKTTGTNVMLCGNDGTPDGHMTMANLANVLGVNLYPGRVNPGFDFNDETVYAKTGISLYEIGSPEGISNVPGSWGVVVNLKAYWNGNQFGQIFIGGEGIRYRRKDGAGDWTAWKTVSAT